MELIAVMDSYVLISHLDLEYCPNNEKIDLLWSIILKKLILWKCYLLKIKNEILFKIIN